MIKLLTPLLLTLPILAHGTPIYVEYEGTVESINSACWCGSTGYAIGDAVQGVLKIDTELAPPDRFPENPNRGNYWARAFGGQDFISGSGRPQVPQSDDFVGVENRPRNAPGLYDGYAVDDWSFQHSGVNETWIEAFSYTRDLVSGEGLIQQIDVKPSDDLRLIGWIRRQTGAMSYKVWLNLTHVSVTPGQCRAH